MSPRRTLDRRPQRRRRLLREGSIQNLLPYIVDITGNRTRDLRSALPKVWPRLPLSVDLLLISKDAIVQLRELLDLLDLLVHRLLVSDDLDWIAGLEDRRYAETQVLHPDGDRPIKGLDPDHELYLQVKMDKIGLVWSIKSLSPR